MSVGALGLWLDNIPLMLTGVFLMSTHSAIFGPTKYGMLPELLPEKKLSWGNGMFGTGHLFRRHHRHDSGRLALETFSAQRQIWSGVILIALAVVGLSLCLGITPRCPPPTRHKRFRANFLGDFWSQLTAIRRDRVLFLGVARQHLLLLPRDAAAIDCDLSTARTFCISTTGTSSYLQGAHARRRRRWAVWRPGYLSGGKIEYGLIPLGAMAA